MSFHLITLGIMATSNVPAHIDTWRGFHSKHNDGFLKEIIGDKLSGADECFMRRYYDASYRSPQCTVHRLHLDILTV
jgi:hypothetical protein